MRCASIENRCPRSAETARTAAIETAHGPFRDVFEPATT
jgi:hypothetical protein